MSYICQDMIMNSYTNFALCPHNPRQSEGKEPLQAALFYTCKPVGKGRELGGMKGVPHHWCHIRNC